MADVRRDDGFTGIAHTLIEVLCRAKLPGLRHMQVVLAVARETYGVFDEETGEQRTQAVVSSKDLQRITGMSAGNARDVVRDLVEARVLTRSKGPHGKSILGIQKDFECWGIPLRDGLGRRPAQRSPDPQSDDRHSGRPGDRHSGHLKKLQTTATAVTCPIQGLIEKEGGRQTTATAVTLEFPHTPAPESASRFTTSNEAEKTELATPDPPLEERLVAWFCAEYLERRSIAYLPEQGDGKRLASMLEAYGRDDFIPIVELWLTDKQFHDDFVREKGWNTWALSKRAQRIAAKRGAIRRQKELRALRLEEERARERGFAGAREPRRAHA